jgi:hypothetical protein
MKPTQFADLLRDHDEIFSDNAVRKLMQNEPHKSWLKKNEFAKGADYLPIDKVEYLLDNLFASRWKVEILITELTETTVSVTIRLHYFDEKQGEWMFHDGVCGVPLKRDALTKEEKATFDQLLFLVGQTGDLIERAKLQTAYYQLKKSRPVKDDAIQGAFQIAKSFAIRDAADHLGKLFGRDLNRKDTFETVSNDAQVTYEQKPAYSAPKAAPQPTQPTATQDSTQAPTQQPTAPSTGTSTPAALNFNLLG